MLITNEKFLKHVAPKKLVTAFDVSGSISYSDRELYVATMHGLVNNCTRKKGMPIMLTFDHDVYDVTVDVNVQLARIGGTDIEQCMTYIKVLDKPDVVLYITDGYVCWPKENILPRIEQYVHFTGPQPFEAPSYIKII